MKEYDYVKLTVEKDRYAKDGVHKGMTGWICDERIINNQRLISFEEYDGSEIACIAVNESDLEVVWSAPTNDVGVAVILLTANYENMELRRGLKGTIVAKGKEDKQWIVRFEKQDGLQYETDCAVYENDIAII